MNRKGFTLVELLACLALLGLILCIGLFVTRGTLSTSLSTLTDVSEKQIYDAAEIYTVENNVKWTNFDELEYTCLNVKELVEKGYFKEEEVTSYKDNKIKIEREVKTKTIDRVRFVDTCE